MTGLRRWTLGMLILLMIQLGIGMYTNLFVTIPVRHPGAGAGEFRGVFESINWALSHSAVPLATHAGLGIILALGAIGILVRSARLRRGIWGSSLGLLFILGAGYNGGRFVAYNNDINSLVMALAFAAAVVCYAAVLYLPATD